MKPVFTLPALKDVKGCSRMSRSNYKSLSLAIGTLVLMGCGEELGGVQAKTDVSIKVVELDDEDVPTIDRQRAAEAGVEVPVLTPSGQVVVPPDRQDLVVAEEPPEGEPASEDGQSDDAAADE